MRWTSEQTAGTLFGVSLAGLADGIFLHQILQWHHMICQETHCASTSVSELQQKTFADGLFHAACWLILLAGLWQLSRRPVQQLGRQFWGAILLGAGAFNVAEGLIDHHLLRIHHVRFGPGQPTWDLGFLAISLVIAVTGWLTLRRRLASY